MPEENTCETFGNVTFKKFFFFKKDFQCLLH